MTNRFRVSVTFSVLSLAGCIEPAAKTPALPKSISPGWVLADIVKGADGWVATYRGPGTAHVRIAAITGTSAGAERMKRFRVRANAIAFYSGRYFTAVDWDGADPTDAGALVRKLENAERAGY